MVTCTVQVTNVSPHASERQMKELFSYFGGIDEIRVYPEDDSLYSVPSKVCFVTFKERSSLETALHLTNTVFIDRALIVAQSRYEVIPDEDTALSLAAPAVASVGGTSSGNNALIPSAAPLLPTPGAPSQPSLLGAPSNALLQTPLSNALQQVQAAASSIAAAVQAAPVLTVAGSVIPNAPPITGNVDPTKIDEIRRTVYVGNLNTHLTADQVMHFFQPCGEIRYVRMAGDETQPTRFAFVEFTNPESVPIALQYNGALFGDRPVKVNHSKNAIVKPQGKTPELAQREVDEAMQKVREASMAISTAIEPPSSGSKRRSKFRSRTPSPNSSHRSRRSPVRRKSRSRSPGRRRSRSRSPRGRRRNSRSPRRRKSRSRSPRRRRSHSRSPARYKKRSSSRSPRRRDYYRSSYSSSSRHGGSSSYYRHRSRSPDRDRNRRRRRSYSRSRSRSPKRSSSSRKSQRSYDDRDYRRRDRSPSPSEHKKSHKKKSKKEKRHKRSRSPTPHDSLSPEQSDVDSGHEEEEEAGSRQSSDAEMVEETVDKDTSRSDSDKATSEDDD